MPLFTQLEPTVSGSCCCCGCYAGLRIDPLVDVLPQTFHVRLQHGTVLLLLVQDRWYLL